MLLFIGIDMIRVADECDVLIVGNMINYGKCT